MSDNTPDRYAGVRAAAALANAFRPFLYRDPAAPPPAPRDLTDAECQDVVDWVDTLMHEWEASRAARQAREGAEERSPDA
jgi:hypothetical protein